MFQLLFLQRNTQYFLITFLAYNSCKEIYDNKTDILTDKVYELQSGKHFCVMRTIDSCGAGGWTLAMTIDGSKAR